MKVALRRMLPAARRIDRVMAAIGRVAAWLVLAACLLSICNALMRYGLHFAQPLLLDLPMLLFSVIVLCGARARSPKTAISASTSCSARCRRAGGR